MTSNAGGTLLCWHAERAGIEVLEQAIKALRNRKIEISHVLYLVQSGGARKLPSKIDDAEIEVVEMSIDDPTQHSKIYTSVQEKVLPRLRDIKGDLHLNISPGTPAMHSVWLVLHAGGSLPLQTRLWSSQLSKETKRTRIDPVDFPITTYLAEIHRYQQINPDLAVYAPAALSRARLAALDNLHRYARVIGSPLLILGERGTGKTRLVETFVSVLKNKKKVVTVPCGTLDSTLAESFLFGHRKGAFTDAASDRQGVVAEADGGILFLDEVQDLPKSAQRKLVRVFQDRQRRYRPLGSDKEVSVDVELVCASNLPIAELRNRLDSDLFDRISHLTVYVPPLRDCREDIRNDWLNVWRELRLRDDLPYDPPWTNKLEQALNQNALPGNLRDLQRLAILLMAWWPDKDRDGSVQMALREWTKWSRVEQSDDESFGNGTRNDRVRWFRSRLAQWSKEQYGTWIAAAKSLDCDEKTLRNDAVLPDLNE